ASSTSARSCTSADANTAGVIRPPLRFRARAATTSAAPSIRHISRSRAARAKRWSTRAAPGSRPYRLTTPLPSPRTQIIPLLSPHINDLGARQFLSRFPAAPGHHFPHLPRPDRFAGNAHFRERLRPRRADGRLTFLGLAQQPGPAFRWRFIGGRPFEPLPET